MVFARIVYSTFFVGVLTVLANVPNNNTSVGLASFVQVRLLLAFDMVILQPPGDVFSSMNVFGLSLTRYNFPPYRSSINVMLYWFILDWNQKFNTLRILKSF